MNAAARRWVRLAILSTSCTVAACASGPEPIPGPVPMPAAQPSPIAEEPALLAVRPNDTISVSVLREPDLSLDNVIVGESGQFMMPLVGAVQAAGKRPEEIAGDIRSQLAANYLVNPIVTVNVMQYGSRIVTVEGAVDGPGMYQFTPDTTLLGALALASGPEDTVARLSDVAIFRKIDGVEMVAVYDLKLIRAGQAADPRILPGDKVVVGFSQLGEGLENILRTVPVFGLFTRF